MDMASNTESTEALRLHNLKKRFGHLEIIKGISITAHRGDVIAILGSSGSGKSTLLRCLNFLETPDEGEMWVGGDHLRLTRGLTGQRQINAPAHQARHGVSGF